jgi:hypothetical protein
LCGAARARARAQREAQAPSNLPPPPPLFHAFRARQVAQPGKVGGAAASVSDARDVPLYQSQRDLTYRENPTYGP